MKVPLMNFPHQRGRRDKRLQGLFLVVAGTALLGYLVNLVPGRGVEATKIGISKRVGLEELRPATSEASSPAQESVPVQSSGRGEQARDPAVALGDRVMQEAEAQLRAKRYDDAIQTLHASHESLKRNARAYLLLGRALEGKKDYETARDFYAAAIDRDVLLGDAYFGFATASEALGDLEAAIGGMRNFLHVQQKADPHKLKVAQARSAIWEWESKLGRGLWGPTKGIPPGFTEAELKRDGRGVGIKMPLPETMQPDGSMRYEIKHQDKFQMFKP